MLLHYRKCFSPDPFLNIVEGPFPQWPSSAAPWLQQDPLKPSQTAPLLQCFFFSSPEPLPPPCRPTPLLESFRKGQSCFDLGHKWSWHLNKQRNPDNPHSPTLSHTRCEKKKKKKSAHRQRACRSLNTQCVREVSFRRSKERVYRGLSPFCVIHDWSTRSISPQWAQRFIRLLDSLIFGKRRREERGRGGILGRPLRFMLVEDQTALCSPAGWIAVMSGDCLSLFPTDWKKIFSSSYCDFFFFQQTKHP